MRPSNASRQQAGQAGAGPQPLRVAACRVEADQVGRATTLLRWNMAIGRVLAYMRAHLDEPQSTEKLADVAALSRFHFNRVFRLVTGLPPAFFLTALRIEAAKHLLLTTERSVTDVCMDVGYTSLGTFVSRFTDLVGLSPRAFRRAAQLLDGVDMLALLSGHDGMTGPAPIPVSAQARIIAPEDAVMVCAALYDVRLPGARPRRCATLVGSGYVYFDRLPAGTYVILAGAIRPMIDAESFLDRGVFVRGASPGFSIGRTASYEFDMALRPSLPFDPPVLAPLPGMIATRMMEGADSMLSAMRMLSGPDGRWPAVEPGSRRRAIRIG
jgi:AraC family transcriptional regulator